MRNRSRPLLALGLSALSPLLSAAAPAPAAQVQVNVTVTDLRNSKGVVRACMTANPERFPRCRDDAASFRLVVPAEEHITLQFANVRPGTYAIALLHDENDNGRADRALMMMPREGFGFSRDAPVHMGPPDFEEAAFAVGSAAVRQTIRMRYML